MHNAIDWVLWLTVLSSMMMIMFALLCLQVTAATSQTMLLLTSAASTITYAQLGDIPWTYAAVLMPVAFAATLAGQLALDALIRRLGRGGVVVMVLAGFFLIACGLTYYVAADSLRHVVAVGVAAATQPGRVCG
jgi:uncharacterized membrane protein YfcA